MKVKVYASFLPEYLCSKGKAVGLEDEAADYFRYFTELEIEVDVEPKTGTVLGAAATQKF